MLDATVPRISHRRTRPMNGYSARRTPGEPFIITPPPSCPFHTNQQTASLPRRGYEDHQGMAGRGGGGGGGGPQGFRGCSIRPLKRAKDGDDEWETPSLTQKPRREGLGEGHWLRPARNQRRDAVDTGDPERGRLGRRLSSVLSTAEGSCLFSRNRAFVARSLEEGTEPVR